MSSLPYDGSSADTPSVVGLSDLSGQQIGRYLIQGRIGSGGVATVYQAYDQVLGRSVALKILLPHSDQNTHSRFRREALMAGSLRHPHIVRILQVGNAFQGGVAYIAMELVEGESLGSLLVQYGKLGQEESCNLLEPVARALAFAHLNGIVHRDVKPSNILLSPVNPGTANRVQLECWENPVVPLLSDFGIARFLDAPELTSTGRTVGTPAFMAPEQCTGSRELDGRTDVYALGTVLFRCLTGRLPYSGSMTKVLHAHVYEPLMIDNNVLVRLSPQVLQILKRSLAKAPDDRYPSAEEMAVDLAEAARRSEVPPTTSRGGDAEQGKLVATATLTLAPVAGGDDEAESSGVTVLIPAPGTLADDLPETQPRAAGMVDWTASGSGRDTHVEAEGKTRRRWTRGRWYRGVLALGALLAIVVAASLSYPALIGQVGPDLDSESSVGTDNERPALGVIAPPVSPTLTTALDRTLTPAPAATPTPVTVASPTQIVLPSPTAAIQIAPAATEPPVIVSPTTADPVTEPPGEDGDADGTAPAEEGATVPDVTVEAQTPAVETPIAPEQSGVEREDAGVVSVCTNVVDAFFANAVLDLSVEDRSELACPVESAYATGAEILPFENGFMMRLDEDPSVYVYYEQSQVWAQKADIVREAAPTGVIVAPPGMFLPQQAYGRLWQQERRRAALGFALQPEPTRFGAIVQKFPGALLIGNKDSGAVYAFVVSRLQL